MPASPHRGRADFRVGQRDQFGRRGSRPEQAKRDQDGEADPSYAKHFIPHLGKIGVAYFSPFECEVAHTSRGINGGSGGHQTPTASRRPSRGRWRAILVASHPSEMLSSHVILLTLDVGLHVSRRHQPHRMAECLELARPVVRRGASLDPNQTYWQFLEERQETVTAQMITLVGAETGATAT